MQPLNTTPTTHGGGAPTRFLRMPEVTWRVGLSAPSIYRLIRKKQFPSPVRIGAMASGWFEHEVSAWLEARASERNDGKAAA